MKKVLIAMMCLSLMSCGGGSRPEDGGEESTTESSSSSSGAPTEQDIRDAMARQHNMEGSPGSPRRSVEVHSVKIGSPEDPDEQDRIDGIPEKSKVTMAKIEYTKRTHYTDAIKAFRETGTFKVFKNDFGEWVCMLDGSEGTKYFDEPSDVK
jgi:hypothetical protein